MFWETANAVKSLAAVVDRAVMALQGQSNETAELRRVIRDGFARTNQLLSRLIGPERPVGRLEFEPLVPGDRAMKFRALLPGLPDGNPNNADAVAGRLTVNVNGTPTTYDTVIGATAYEPLEFAPGDRVSGHFVFVDAAGNESLNPVIASEFVVPDNVPPPDPAGELTFEAIA